MSSLESTLTQFETHQQMIRNLSNMNPVLDMKRMLDTQRNLGNFNKQMIESVGLKAFAKDLQQFKDSFSPWSKDKAMKPFMFEPLSKIMNDQRMMFDNLKGIGNILKDQSLRNGFNYGTRMEGYASALKDIYGLQEVLKGPKHMLDDLRMLQGFPKLNDSLADLLAFAKSFQRMNAQIADTITRQKRWEDLEQYQELNEKAGEIIHTAVSGHAASGMLEKFNELIALAKEFIKQNKQHALKIYRFINFVIQVVTLAQCLGPSQHSTNNVVKEDLASVATKEDVAKLTQQMIALRAELEVKPDKRCVLRATRIMFKPSSKTMVVFRPQRDFEVIVLQTNHTWVYVSFINPKLDLPQTGWILKKYLSASERD